MKRKGLFILCALISLTLCACGGGSKADPYEPSYEEESSSETVPDSTAAGSDEGITDDGETWEEEKARLEDEHRRRMEEQAAQEQSIRQMLEEQAAYESDSYEDEAEEGAAESDVAGENICPDCGFERLEVTCGLCSGTGNTASCTRCGGTGIICRNCFYPPSQPSTAGGTSGGSSGKAGRMCGRCHGDGLEGECFSCGGTGILGHTEYYGSGWGGDTYYTTRPCMSCVGGERRCTLCGGDGFVDDE